MPSQSTSDPERRSDLGKSAKASFAAFLYHALSLVYAVPKTESPTMDDIRKELEICLTVIITAMNDEANKSDVQTIANALKTYCNGYPETNQRQAFVEAANAALIFLQPLSIGNSRHAANSDSDDSLLFMRQNRAVNGTSDDSRLSDDRMPDICCVSKKNVVEGWSKDWHQPAVEVELDPLLEWKEYDSCWESIRNIGSLDIPQPFIYNQDYTGDPLKEYGHTEDYNPSPIVHGLSDSDSKDSHNSHGVETSLDPPNDSDIPVHPINVEWCVEDAKKVFYDTFGRDHIMNVGINDDLLRVWYFDHESTIQTSAFNFISDLPYFLLFLFALQRFSRADWGYIEQLSPVNARSVEPVNLSDDPQSNEGTPSHFAFKRLHDHFQAHHHCFLSGRATHVIYGQSIKDGLDESAVLKLSWRQKVRFQEGSFLREATKLLHEQGYPDVCDYLPTLLADKDFPQFSTDIIRRRLMLPIVNEETCLPYFIVLPRYEPLTVRTTDWMSFFDDFMALIYCHFMLWSVGIEHADISVRNLMWDPRTQKPKLCDFDLSYFSRHEQIGFKNTGTQMFMAIDLLFEGAMKGEVKRLYRHDLESFIAVLVWIILCYNQGQRVIPDNPALLEWNSSTPGHCRVDRQETYANMPYIARPTHVPSMLWWFAIKSAQTCAKISAESRYLTTISQLSTSKQSSDYEISFSSEEKKKLDYFNSDRVITDFLELLPKHSTLSDFVQEIIQKITVHVSL